MNALITQRQSKDKNGADIDSLERDYISYYSQFGLDLIPVSNFTTDPSFFFKLDIGLVIITGGGSIPGCLYDKQTENVDSEERDRIEKFLIFEAISRKIPILAICRGMQYINALLGGKISVLSNLPLERTIGVDHKISFYNNFIYVNNYHNDGIYVRNLSPLLEPIGIDTENDVVEIYLSKEKHILGIQSHPERIMKDNYSKKIITELITNFLNIN